MSDEEDEDDINSPNNPNNQEDATRMTCDVLCSLGAVGGPAFALDSSTGSACASMTYAADVSFADCSDMGMTECTKGGKSASLSACPKQHQLPMFLSKTYHMIDRCEPGIATWSMDGSNFVVKNVEKFASSVLPLYFKHSNFSSFARQLNFYGFRKLRTDPILTSDLDPRTACYVRFYHEKFQKDRPELLHQIKRATKSDQQSKDDVESLKGEVCKLRDTLAVLRDDTDRRLAEMAYECNRRITNMAAEYDKLAAIVQQLSAASKATNRPCLTATAPTVSSFAMAPTMVSSIPHHNPHAASIATAAAVAAGAMGTGFTVQESMADVASTPDAACEGMAAPAPATLTTALNPPRMADLMHSLSQAAVMSLQQQQEQQQQRNSPTSSGATFNHDAKRPADVAEAMGAPPGKQRPAKPHESQPA